MFICYSETLKEYFCNNISVFVLSFIEIRDSQDDNCVFHMERDLSDFYAVVMARKSLEFFKTM